MSKEYTVTQVGEVPYAMHPDFAQALKGFAYAGVAYEGPPPAALTPEIAALLGVNVAAEPSADMKPRAAEAAARISAQKLNVPVALQGALEEAIDAIADAKTPEELSAALAAAETLIDQANAKADGHDKLEGPQEKMDAAWRAFDEADKKLDDAFLKLPLTEKEREHYAELQAKEEEARKRMENARTPEEKAAAVEAWQQATANTHAYVVQTTEAKEKSGEITTEQAEEVKIAVDDRTKLGMNIEAVYTQIDSQKSLSAAEKSEQETKFSAMANRDEFAKLQVSDGAAPRSQLLNLSKQASSEIAPGSFI